MCNSRQIIKLSAQAPSAVVCLDICFITAGIITPSALIAEFAKVHIVLQKGQRNSCQLGAIQIFNSDVSNKIAQRGAHMRWPIDPKQKLLASQPAIHAWPQLSSMPAQSSLLEAVRSQQILLPLHFSCWRARVPTQMEQQTMIILLHSSIDIV